MITRWSPARDVLVGVARTGPFEEAAAATRAWAMLDDSGRAAVARLRAPAARAEHVAGRLLAHTLLAQRVGCEPEAIRLRVSRLGRPEVTAPLAARRLSFSIAHSDGVALCAVTARGAIGADIESVRNVGRDPLAVAEVVCSERENQELRATPASRRARRLLAMWTAKEALAKAAGLGANLPFAEIAIPARWESAALVRWTWGARGEDWWWRLLSLRPTQQHVATVAVLVGIVPRARGTEAA